MLVIDERLDRGIDTSSPSESELFELTDVVLECGGLSASRPPSNARDSSIATVRGWKVRGFGLCTVGGEIADARPDLTDMPDVTDGGEMPADMPLRSL